MRDGNLFLLLHRVKPVRPFRPSYEGWKLFLFFFSLFPLQPFRPSYEGWKRENISAAKLDKILLLDLPMRDGNLGVANKKPIR